MILLMETDNYRYSYWMASRQYNWMTTIKIHRRILQTPVSKQKTKLVHE